MGISVDCVVVTYNKVDLLKECLAALLKQTYVLNTIFVIDNNSDDSTKEFLDSFRGNDISKTDIKVIHLKKNIGGSGGFNIGLKNFISNSKSQYVWIMDDDTIPNKDSLEKLINKLFIKTNVGFLSSNVRWKDQTAALMNVPQVARDWNSNADEGIIKLESATFVSILVSRDIIKRIGYPVSDFFIWGDDVEYTLRIGTVTKNNYLVCNSLVTHKMSKNIGADILDENNRNKLHRYYYGTRNMIYTEKKYNGTYGFFRQIIINFITIFKIIRSNGKYKFKKVSTLLHGILSGCFYNPKIK
ncbi:glycosyltransferase family 2 protein [Lactiplantibacillus plantarum]|uniref:glycosyltransferase family 2 protein n=1 Tax=Lactiplantibacillus plantarum TaxID=1590 RepID=UPI001E4C6E0D|nr:glycosyltransferase family 2 protein [Lactiplantibacillus plantarum]MCC9316325.1 glycosyltransferase family 2 protein [Lactiplantibacillus plantarum]